VLLLGCADGCCRVDALLAACSLLLLVPFELLLLCELDHACHQNLMALTICPEAASCVTATKQHSSSSSRFAAAAAAAAAAELKRCQHEQKLWLAMQ
jgi:hypothetical protein